MNKRRRVKSVSIRLFLNLIAVFLVCIMLLIEATVSFNVYSKIVDQKIGEIYQNDLRQVNDQISIEFRQIDNLIAGIILDNAQNQFCSQYRKESNIFLKNQLQKKIKNDLVERTLDFRISGFEICYENGEKMMLDNNITISDYMPGYAELRKRIIVSDRQSILLKANRPASQTSDRPVNYIFAAIMKESGSEVGILILQMESTWLNNLFGSDYSVVLLDRQNQTIVSGSSGLGADKEELLFEKMTNESGSFTIRINQEDWQIQYQDIESNGLTTVIIKSLSELIQTIQQIRLQVILFTLFSCFASFSLGGLILIRMVKPIQSLLDQVKMLGIETIKSGERQHDENGSMRNSVFLYFIIVILIPMLVYIITFYYGASGNIKIIVNDSLTQTVKTAAKNIVNYLEINESASIDMVMENGLQRFLLDHNEKEADISLVDIIELNQIVKKSLVFVSSSTRVELYNRHYKLVYASDDYNIGREMAEQHVLMAINSYGDAIWNYTDTNSNGEKVICMVRKIYDLRSSIIPFQTIGFLRLSIPETEIRDLYRNISYESSSFFVLDKNGRYISSLYEARIGEFSDYIADEKIVIGQNRKIIRNIKTYEIIAAGDSRMPLTFVGEISQADMVRDNSLIISSSLYLILTICIVIMIFSYMLSMFSSRVFDKMTHKLIRFFKGDYQVDFTSRFNFNEIDQLAITFNDMSLRINDLTQTLYYEHIKANALEKEKKEAELNALLAQINPHFLYNTIESIKWMMNDNHDGAEHMLTKLGEFFRLGISNKEQLVTIAEEVRYANTYIEIQRLRYKDQVQILWEVDEQIIEYTIPKFTLQPLIENAFRHAFQRKRKGGILRICGYSEEEHIIFSIIDNGDGIPRQRLEEMRDRLASDLPGESVGVYNVQKRIKLYYGDKGGITFLSQAGVSTIVRVCIPAVRHNAQNSAQ